MVEKQKVWETNNYYDKAHISSLDLNNPGIRLLLNLSKKSRKILDLGCGDGSRLSLLSNVGTGVDVSVKAISIAKKRYPKCKFIIGNLENLTFPNDSFDLLYSAYVFEHIDNVEKVINEIKRVLTPSGNLVIICPNYGAPNRASPPFTGSRINKFISGFLNDLLNVFRHVKTLNWVKVTPIKGEYKSDFDVTIEPYSLSLSKYLESNGFLVEKNFQTWEYELEAANILQKIFRFLGLVGIYPFYYWSPHIVIQAKKI
ncbi:MAG TPA: class I SAM-dependent methyltransferase [Patescibacteria group bacterium]|nr:class I SAM-dependent methyltransferase [Patescibacteria group bacterium]